MRGSNQAHWQFVDKLFREILILMDDLRKNLKREDFRIALNASGIAEPSKYYPLAIADTLLRAAELLWLGFAFNGLKPFGVKEFDTIRYREFLTVISGKVNDIIRLCEKKTHYSQQIPTEVKKEIYIAATMLLLPVFSGLGHLIVVLRTGNGVYDLTSLAEILASGHSGKSWNSLTREQADDARKKLFDGHRCVIKPIVVTLADAFHELKKDGLEVVRAAVIVGFRYVARELSLEELIAQYCSLNKGGEDFEPFEIVAKEALEMLRRSGPLLYDLAHKTRAR